MEDLINIFKDRTIDFNELLMVLLQFFGSAERKSKEEIEFFKSEKSKLHLSIKTISNKEIFDNVINHSLTNDDIKIIIKSLRSAFFVDKGYGYSKKICFSQHPVKGYFKYKDEFQIFPISKKEQERYSDNPFILEFKYKVSENQSVNEARKECLVSQYIRLLNLFFMFPLKYEQEIGFKWVLDKSTINLQSTYSQLGYVLKGFTNSVASFSSVKEFPSLMDIDGEYRMYPNAEDLIEKYFKLSLNDKNVFDSALYWFYIYSKIREVSTSAGYATLVTSIECLIDHKGKKCDKCGQSYYKINEKFKDFIEKYLDEKLKEKLVRDGVSELYKYRSSLVHGLVLFKSDGDPRLNQLLSLKNNVEKESTRNLENVVQFVLQNWLDSH